VLYKVTTKTHITLAHVYDWLRRTEKNPARVIFQEDWANRTVILKDPTPLSIETLISIGASVTQEEIPAPVPS
jgi:hypothetical protein